MVGLFANYNGFFSIAIASIEFVSLFLRFYLGNLPDKPIPMNARNACVYWRAKVNVANTTCNNRVYFEVRDIVLYCVRDV